MVFSSLTFICIFLPLFLLTYFAVRNLMYRNIVLLIFSLVFYAWGEPLYVLLMLFSIVMNYLFALHIEKRQKKDEKCKTAFVFAVILNLALIGFFKYLDFFGGIVGSIIGVEMPRFDIALPIGISFYTFQILSYVVDVYRREVPAQHNVLYLGAYLSAFPQLIAGPIVRYQTVANELMHRRENFDDFAYGVRRFVQGLGKKVLIANSMAFVVDNILPMGAQSYGALGAWVAMLAYTLQIYFDFSGYSDMAIGMGRMMGFKFLENFDYPYIAKSVTDFWRRWHISLSTFFRDYVYIPLGGNRVKPLRHALNIFVVWMLTGLWHGASWNFVIWGVYYGVFLLIEKFLIGKYLEKMPAWSRHLYTVVIFVFGWVIFRAETLGQIGEILSAMFGGYGAGSIDFLVYTQVLSAKHIITFLLAVLFSTPILKTVKRRIENRAIGRFAVDGAVLVIMAVSIFMVTVSSYNPFIYFRF